LRSSRIRAAVKKVHAQSNGIYGSHKIAQRLQTDDQLVTACRNTVAAALAVTSDAYQQTLSTLGITCSSSRTGCCYDHAVMERFFWSLKHEWTKHETDADLEETRLSVFRYIETLYNSVRLHHTLNYLSPDQYEQQHHDQLAI
jgi:putative transposase